MPRLAGLLALLVLVTGCPRSGGFGLYAPPPQNGVLAIGPVGATDTFVGGSLGGTSVVVPAGALGQTVTITIGGGTPVLTGDATLVGPPVLMTPNDQVFLSPVTIEIPYLTADLPAGKTPSNIVVLAQDPATGAITVIKPTTVNTVGLLVGFTTSKFANFQAAVFDAGPPTITGTASPEGGSPPVIATTGGQAVTITGTNLFQGATVTFGAVPVSGNLVNANATGTLLTVVTPPGAAGPVAITVTNLDGLTAAFANAFLYSAGPVFPAAPGTIGVTPYVTFTGAFPARDPSGKTLTYAFSPPVPNLSVDGSGNVTFTPSLFQAGTLTATLTATGTGTSSLMLTFAVSRLGAPSILFSDAAVFPGAPGGAGLATPLPAPTSLSSLGAFAAPVSFVGTTTVGVLYRSGAAGIGSSVVGGAIAPPSGITVVAAGGSSAGGNLVFRDPTSQFLVGSTGVDGTAAFVADVTSDRTTTDPPDFAQALFLVSGAVALSGPFAQTGTAAPTGGAFSSLATPLPDGAGGAFFAAQVTSSTNPAVTVNALFHAAGQVTLVAQEGTVAGAAGTLQAGQPITTVGATAAGVVCLVTTQLGVCLVQFSASGQATELAAPGLVLDAGAHTLQSIVAASTSLRSLQVDALVKLDAGATNGVYAFASAVGRIVRQNDALLGGSVNAIAALSSPPEDGAEGVTQIVALTGASATAALVRALPGGSITIVVDNANTVVPTAGGKFSSFVAIGSGGAESSWASAITGGADPSGLFELSQGTQVAALVLETQPLPGSLAPATFGSFVAVPATAVHPESGVVVTAVPVTGGAGFTQVVVAR